MRQNREDVFMKDIFQKMDKLQSEIDSLTDEDKIIEKTIELRQLQIKSLEETKKEYEALKNKNKGKA